MKSERLLILLAIVVGLFIAVPKIRPLLFETSSEHAVNRLNIHYFKDLTGPRTVSHLPPKPERAPWRNYTKGGSSRLAILLSDPSAPWLGLVHGLKSIGVPFIVTTDYRQAIRHRVVLVYPMVPGPKLSQDALQALHDHPFHGGTLLASNVLGGGMFDIFGVEDALPSRAHRVIRFKETPLTQGFQHEREKEISLGSDGLIGSYAYTHPKEAPLATYEDGSAAIVQRHWGKGRAIALGVDIGHMLMLGANNLENGISRNYVNQFEPTLDMFLRFIANVYRAGEPNAVTLWSVPAGKSLSVLMTHDIDYAKSLANAVEYARYEKSQGIRGTYFTQVKYIKDFNDEYFYNRAGVKNVQALRDLGMEVASHSVSHSRQYARLPQGSGRERYPTYVPYVVNSSTTYNGTVFGELRISKFLLENFLPGYEVVSFRPGHLSVPKSLPESLLATGYKYSSSVTANNALSHLPYQLNHNLDFNADLPVFEFPVTVEDEEAPRMDQRVAHAIRLAHHLSRYGGLFNVLIHPNVLAHKMTFEKEFVSAVAPFSWFGSVSDFGDWWAARNEVTVDSAGAKRLTLEAPVSITGLTLIVPKGWKFQGIRPENNETPRPRVEQIGQRVVISGPMQGRYTLQL